MGGKKLRHFLGADWPQELELGKSRMQENDKTMPVEIVLGRNIRDIIQKCHQGSGALSILKCLFAKDILSMWLF